jgi:CrcB protein
MIGDIAAVSLGAVAGALSRYQIGNIATRIIAEDKRLSPLTGWHTAAINIFGSFILGTLAGTPTLDTSAKQDMKGISPRVRLMAGVGFCGSFTTFSTFSVDIIGMLNSGKMVRAITYATVNNVGGVAAAFAGFNMAKRIIKN